jgi:hypothetical protein
MRSTRVAAGTEVELGRLDGEFRGEVRGIRQIREF